MDMLIRLYETPDSPEQAASEGLVVRRPLAPEHDLVVAWVTAHFTAGWASEARAALSNRPPSLFVAIRDNAVLGFCCYDTTARGFVGPIGVTDAARGQGIGAALLHACMADMRALGYAYAVAGAVGAPEFFRSAAGATEIEGSSPGIYRGMLRP
jgi:ribosomal protein S18 acetylase RimI-like enzyme